MTSKQLDKWLSGHWSGSDLDLWTAWNNCKDWNDGQAIETSGGQQFLMLTDGVVMMSEPNEYITWKIKIMSDHVFKESYIDFSDIRYWKLVKPRELE